MRNGFWLWILLVIGVFAVPRLGNATQLDAVVDEVVHRHMAEKRIPGLSVAIIKDGSVVLSRGYGKASLEFDLPATPDTLYPISSVSKIFTGLLAARLVETGQLSLDTPVATFVDGVPADKSTITVRHLLQHTHGLADFYRSEEYSVQAGKSVADSTTEELVRWSLQQPLHFEPGADWQYSLTGYVILARVLEQVGGMPFERLVSKHVLEPIGITAAYGGTESVVPGRNSVMYELVDNQVAGHVVEFPPYTYAAGGLNLSVRELGKVFTAISGDKFIGKAAKHELWASPTLADGKPAHYALGWFSYTTSQDRWVVGHEGGGASWVIYYPDLDLAVIALSNMSGARADTLPYEIVRNAIAEGLL